MVGNGRHHHRFVTALIASAVLGLLGTSSAAGAGDGPSVRQAPAASAPTTTDAAIAGGLIVDGGFESTAPPADNPNWTEFSAAFGSPICSKALCGGGSDAVPRRGLNWVWFGGTADETASVTQTVPVPPGAVTLTFWLRILATDPDSFLAVSYGGQEVFRVTGAEQAPYVDYAQVAVTISPLADGTPKVLAFSYAADELSNFHVDDITVRSHPRDCADKAASIVGTQADDDLVGTAGKDVFAMLDGDDIATGGDGNDWLCGGGGADELRGGFGNDRLYAGADHVVDRLVGGAGSDECSGGPEDIYITCEG